MDCYDDPNVRQISVMKSAQTGFTQGFTNMIGKAAHLNPGPIGVYYPTEAGVKKFSKRKFNQMVTDTPVLRGKFQDARKREGGNSILEKDFPGGFVSMAGGQSVSNYASQTLRDIYVDELSRFPVEVGNEGDFIDLLKMRQENFENSKLVLVSTPTIEDLCRITAEYKLSDQRKYYVPCPKCGRMQLLEFKQLKGWRKEKGVYEPEATYYECINRRCKAHLSERDKHWMTANGKWRKGNPKVKDHAGFWINSLYSPLPKARWDLIIKQWINYLETGRKITKLKTLLNTRFAIPFEDRTAKKYDDNEIGELMKRREDYGINLNIGRGEVIIPKGAAVLTAGVDTQDDRFEMEVTAWGLNDESWLIDYAVIMGDTATTAAFQMLDMHLLKTYQHELGARLRIAAACIDSLGHRTTMVTNFTKGKGHRNIYATYGKDSPGVPIFAHQFTRNKDTGGKMYPVGTYDGKSLIFSRLSICDFGTGYMHFPKQVSKNYTIDEEYFKMLTAEVLRTDPKKEKKYWDKIRTRNEALDCRNYSQAALYSLNMDNQMIQQILDIIEKQNEEAETPRKEQTQQRQQGNFVTDGLIR